MLYSNIMMAMYLSDLLTLSHFANYLNYIYGNPKFIIIEPLEDFYS